MDINIMIGGEAGQGLVTVGDLLTKSLVRSSYFVHVYQNYMSRIRGGHNYYCVRTGPKPVNAPVDHVNILVALNEETVEYHKGQLADKGLILIDEKNAKGDGLIAVPFGELAPKPIFENVVALGVLCSILGLNQDVPAGLMKQIFKKKGDEIIEQNLKVLADSYTWAASAGIPCDPLSPAEDTGKRLMMNGNEALSLGAMYGGINFCSFYPMTPATSVAQNLISRGEALGVVVEQAEDEIAAVNMGIGASFAGARVLVPTSGGGFALMTEGVSLAGIMESPIVMVLAQRPGPATGLPTRTEQADLNLVLYAGHGEFPRAIYTPGTHEEFFRLAYTAVEQTEKWQTPVFVLTDQYFADSFRAVEPFDLDNLPPITPLTLSNGEGESYERYAVTDSGVSPRLIPGFGEHLVVTDSDEHSPDGHITEDFVMRNTMNQKRLRKACGMMQDVVAPTLIGNENPEVLFVCWGTTRGAAEEAAEKLRGQGVNASTLHFSQVWPLNPDQFIHILMGAQKVVCVEGNATGQFAGLIRRQTSYHIQTLVLRYDGNPFTADYILENLAGNAEPVACVL
jgi:2-oxoglutarate ferredoxin oxidoreductase subunit alpha